VSSRPVREPGLDTRVGGGGGVWETALDALEGYVCAHPGITVTPVSLAIPEELRPRFYQLASQVQHALCTKALGGPSAELVEAARLCSGVKQRLAGMSDLVDLRLASAVEALVDNPERALAAPLLGMVLDVVQKRKTRLQLLAEAQETLPGHSERLFRNAYEAWAYYGVVEALGPRRFYEVFSPDTVQASAVASGYVTIGSQATSPERRFPEAVFETAEGRLFAMKSEAARELDYYGLRITRRRDFSAGGNTVDQVAHRVLLLYEIASLDAIPAIADRDKQTVLPSDLMCEVLTPQEIEQPSCLSQFADRINTVRSKRPVQVICFDRPGVFPPEMLEDKRLQSLEQRVVGFSHQRLKEIADLVRN
jgi:hypothetical protein